MFLPRIVKTAALVGGATLALSAPAAHAVSTPFTEAFDDGASGWQDAFRQPLDWIESGGPDGSGFVRSTLDLSSVTVSMGSVVTHRGEQSAGASGGAFAGDWLEAGVTRFTAQVRHDASVPLSFFGRFASPFNFPAAVIFAEDPVEPNQWTELTFEIDPDNPLFTPEGTDFATALGGVGNVQLAFSAPEGFSETVRFDLDNVSVVPEPSSLALLAAGGLAMRRRRGGAGA